MEKLKQQLDELISRLSNSDQFRSQLEDLKSVYPFSEYEYIISHLLADHKLTLDEYCELRDDYIDRNLYLYLFEISAPRGFGEAWAHGHLKELLPGLQRPTKKLDKNYSGQYDFFLPPSVRIEVKASRAVDFKSDEPLYIKALSSFSNSPFDMNFQQIKPACCDVFVWLAAWRDTIRYWVIPSYEVENNPYYSKGQHRGNVGEGQLHLNQKNITEFDKYLCKSTELEGPIRGAFKKDQTLRGRS
ncbi:MAG: hypothetical protein D4R93_03400 [Deltaproteobacteria bacterium]|nr:MAG: hypothetical protein D4R93_03400 [Deltaproteobacteria bacterium]